MRKIFLVIGEQCKDVFIYGKCERFSPEAPVPVFNPVEVVDNLGMAGNVVSNLNAIIGKYGYKGDDDHFGDSVASILSQGGMVKTRYVDKKSNHIFLRVDENDSVLPLDIKDEFIGEIINKSDAIVISDYHKGFLDEETIEWICEKGKDKLIFLDSKRYLTHEILSCVDFVKLNAVEYENAPQRLKILYEDKFIVTLGSNGAMYKNKIYPSHNPLQTIDVSGAGDTFLAAFVFKFIKSKDVAESIEFANEMAEIVVSKRGVSTI
jgi:bifunctional ADP-heptose synthase (sugar kinase/adenylyltransferase)